MILFDYECPHCRETVEKLVETADESVTCSCGARMKKLFSTRGIGQDWFKPGYWRDIAPEPVFVESKQHLKQLCEKHGCYSVALLNENKKTGSSQEIASNPGLAWDKVHKRKKTKEIVNEQYRRVFGDT